MLSSVLLGCFPVFPVPLHAILEKSLRTLKVGSCPHLHVQLDFRVMVQVWTPVQLLGDKSHCGWVEPMIVGQHSPQMKQARARLQNTMPALETLATECYVCQEFAWAQKNQASIMEINVD